MDTNSFSWKHYNQCPVVGILRGISSTEILLKLAETYLEAGFTTLEITMNSDNVLNSIATLYKTFPELNIEAGTVCTVDDYEQAVKSGAKFIVTPIVNDEVIKESVANGIPIFPGAYTPSEIYKAWSLGASAVKVFPATQLGPTYVKDVLAPLHNIKLVPTGGVNINNIKAFFHAGAVGVGMGGNLINKKDVLNQEFKKIYNHLKNLKNEIKDFCIE